jgi:peptide/nickel transport system ATP-binding protein
VTAKPDSAALRLQNVSARYRRGPEVLRGIDLDLAPGERLGVVGRSGCGKSTLVRVAMGLHPYTEGHLTVLGHRLQGQRGGRRQRRRAWAQAQVVFQDATAHLDPWRTVSQMLRRSAALHGHDHPDAAATAALQSVGLSRVADSRLRWLSGGEQRRVAVARINLARPRLLVADEPTAGVDSGRRDALLRLLLQPESGPRPAVLLVSHDLPLVARWCNRVVVLADGRVVEAMAVADLPDAQHPATRALLDAVPGSALRGAP